MTDLSLVGGIGSERVDSSAGAERTSVRRATSESTPNTSAITRPSDRVEISERARLLSKIAAMPDIRSDVVDRVRGEIANGTYETDDKLDSAVQNVLDELDLHG